MNPIKKSLDHIPLPANLHEITKKGIRQSKKKKRKLWITIPTATILLTGSITAAATYNASMNQLVSLLSPELATLLQPIEQTVVNEGIEVEVLSATQDKKSTVIYLAIKDIEKSRITSTLDLYDFSLSKGSSFNAQTVSYNDKTRTAIVRILSFNGIEEDTLTLQIQTLNGYKKKIKVENIPVQLKDASIQKLVPLEEEFLNGSGGENPDLFLSKVLPEGNLNIAMPAYKNLVVQNIGVSEQTLYVQTNWREKDSLDYAFLYLLNDSDKTIDPAFSVVYGRKDNGNLEYGRNFIEYGFDLRNLDLKDLRLGAMIYHYQHQIDGNWKLKFDVKTIKTREIHVNKNISNLQNPIVELSPLGITIEGEGRWNEEDINITFIMKNNQKIKMSKHIANIDDSKSTITFYPDQPIDFEEIQSIYVNDKLLAY